MKGRTDMRRIRMKRKTVRIKKNRIKTSAMLLISFVIFCAYSALMVWQSNTIIRLGTQISALTTEYETAVKNNDDLNGQILKARDLSAVDYYASSVLGMEKAENSDITYVAVSASDTTVASAAQPAFMAWLSNLLN